MTDEQPNKFQKCLSTLVHAYLNTQILQEYLFKYLRKERELNKENLKFEEIVAKSIIKDINNIWGLVEKKEFWNLIEEENGGFEDDLS